MNQDHKADCQSANIIKELTFISLKHANISQNQFLNPMANAPVSRKVSNVEKCLESCLLILNTSFIQHLFNILALIFYVKELYHT